MYLPTTIKGNTILSLINEYKKFINAVQLIDKLNVRVSLIPKAKIEELDDYIEQQRIVITDDIKVFLTSEIENVLISNKEGENMTYGAGTDFNELKYIRVETDTLRNLAGIYGEEDPETKEIIRLHKYGVPLTHEEPTLILDGDPSKTVHGIHRILYDGTPEVSSIATNFTVFLENWIAAGCFSYGDFDKYWEVIKDCVLIKISHVDNLWLQFWDKQYKTNYAKNSPNCA